MKVVLHGYVIVPDVDLEAVREELNEHIRATRLEAGCLRFDVTQDSTDPNRFNVFEDFRDRVSFEMHQERVRSSRWGKVAKNVARHYQVDGLEPNSGSDK